jgi:hypothetical protein
VGTKRAESFLEHALIEFERVSPLTSS